MGGLGFRVRVRFTAMVRVLGLILGSWLGLGLILGSGLKVRGNITLRVREQMCVADFMAVLLLLVLGRPT